MTGHRTLRAGALGAAALLAIGTVAGVSAQSPAASDAALNGDGVLIGLITKTDTNPFFVKMKEGAEAEAAAHGATVQSFAGKIDGDNDSQVAAIENLISAGAKGILITPSDSAAIVPTVQKAKDAGLLVIALDTPLDPIDAAQATFATDNFLAGQYIGQWAAAKLGADAANAKIALLDLNPNGITVDVLRDQGFLKGFGIDLADPNVIGDESDARIVGHDVTNGDPEGGRTAMENLLQKDPSINLVYTINEPAAQGAYEALKAAGREKDVLIVSVDGGCPGVQSIKDGVIGATSMQFPLKMASLGVDAIIKYANDGSIPTPTEGLNFFNTGVQLITDQPVDGLDSQDSTWGLDNCWG
ncbi:MAG: sugar ABC transporter substrate-binding protein [Chloroflexota bacterium]